MTLIIITKVQNLKVSDGYFFQNLPSFLGQEKSAKHSYFQRRWCFTHSSLIVATQSLIILLCATFYISLSDPILWALKFSTDSESYVNWNVQKKKTSERILWDIVFLLLNIKTLFSIKLKKQKNTNMQHFSACLAVVLTVLQNYTAIANAVTTVIDGHYFKAS